MQTLGFRCVHWGSVGGRHARVLPAIMALMDDFTNPRIRVCGWRG